MMNMQMTGGQQPNNANDWRMRMMGMGGGLGAAGAGAYNYFNQGPNPADAANKKIGQIPGATKQYYSPYMQAGQGALGDLQNQYKDLLGGGVQDRLGAGYKESPGYQYALNQALGASNNASAAGGMLGTPQNAEQNMGVATGLASQDYNNYLKNQMGLYGMGLEGEQGLNNQGFQANQDFANQLANVYGQQAAYGYQGQAGQNQAKSNAFGDIFSGLGMFGGGLMGGPMGAAAGGWLSKQFGG